MLIFCVLITTSVSAEGYNVLNTGTSGDLNVLTPSSGNLDNIMNTLPVEDQNGTVINPSAANLGIMVNTLPAEDQDGTVINPSAANLGNMVNTLPAENDAGDVINSNLMADVNITTLTVRLDDTIPISLKENPTTGYLWDVTNSTGLEIVSDEYGRDNTTNGMVGAGGVHKWTVKAVKTGSQTFSAVMIRGDTKPPGEEGTYNLTIIVTETNKESVEKAVSDNPTAKNSVI